MEGIENDFKYIKNSRPVKKSDRDLILSIGIAALIMVGGYCALVLYTGFTSPFSVVMSQSMQHSETQSEIGIIDTGDVVIVKDPSTVTIYSYVEGTQNGYTSFGDYGSVIIYDRGNSQNPVIHRAIVWLEYNADTNTWSAPSLENYSGTWYWLFTEDSSDRQKTWYNMQGILVFEDITQSGKTVSINLNTLYPTSGYLTMGDNISNNYFDQATSIVDHLISMDDIVSVPIVEIPWLGIIKILANGGNNLQYVTNSLPSLIISFVTIFALLLFIDGIALYRNEKGIRYKLDQVRRYSR